MAQRPIWRGHLRLALVSCPVALYSAKHDRNTIRFNMINPETGNRIRMVTQDAETGEPVERSQTVKGYQFKKDHYLLVTDEDLDSVKVESSSVMTVDKFVEANSIDPVYFDASYYVAPDGEAGKDVYAVLREAIVKTGRIALSRVVIGQRERTIALRPMEGGLIAHSLYEGSRPQQHQAAVRGHDRPQGRPGDGAAGGAADRSADQPLRSVGRGGSLRNPATGDAGSEAEGRGSRCRRDTRARSQQRRRPDGGSQEEPATGTRRQRAAVGRS
jgi:hypothetical protein